MTRNSFEPRANGIVVSLNVNSSISHLHSPVYGIVVSYSAIFNLFYCIRALKVWNSFRDFMVGKIEGIELGTGEQVGGCATAETRAVGGGIGLYIGNEKLYF